MKHAPLHAPSLEVSNPQVVAISLYLLGGDARVLDAEDIAIKTRDMFPGRFAWRKYADQVNLEAVKRELSRATEVKHGALIKGSRKHGWLLTEAGVRFAREAEGWGVVGQGRAPSPGHRDRVWLARERTRMLSSPAYQKFIDDRADEIKPEDAEDFFHLDPYVRGAVRETKLQKIRSSFVDDSQLGPAIKNIEGRLPRHEQ